MGDQLVVAEEGEAEDEEGEAEDEEGEAEDEEGEGEESEEESGGVNDEQVSLTIDFKSSLFTISIQNTWDRLTDCLSFSQNFQMVQN